MRKAMKVTFQSSTDAEALALAKMGLGDDYIQKETGLSKGQITYRLGKAKRLEQHEFGYRKQWRSGESEAFKNIKDHMVAVLKKDIQATLPRRVINTKP